MSAITALTEAVQKVLTDDLRREPWKGSDSPLAGHCYVASEALYHLSGKNLLPHHMTWEGASHWFLKTKTGEIVDPTASQFKHAPDYSLGRGKGFLTKQPSKRCAEVLRRVELLFSTQSRRRHGESFY